MKTSQGGRCCLCLRCALRIFAATISATKPFGQKSRRFYEKDGDRTNIVVLACTHYPFLANVFWRLAPWLVDRLYPASRLMQSFIGNIN